MPAIRRTYLRRCGARGTVVPFLLGLSQLRNIGISRAALRRQQWRRMQPPTQAVNAPYYASTVFAERDASRIETTVEITDDDLLGVQ